MKQALLFSFIFFTAARFCNGQFYTKQSSDSDSFAELLEKKNSSFIGEPFPAFVIVANGEIFKQGIRREGYFYKFLVWGLPAVHD